MQKTSTYFRTIVAFRNLRDRAKETKESWQERGLSDRLHDGWNNTRQAVKAKTKGFFTHPEDVRCEHIPQKYNYVFRPKSRLELILLSGTVCGIEFCYAAETAFVTPILLSLGLSIKFVTMIWCLSPLIGLFLTPILGSMSDSCESKFGRRRPFIIMYSIGIILGLLLVPNGQHIGLALGDKGYENSYPAIMLNGTSENGNAARSIQANDLNADISNEFYSKDFNVPNTSSMTFQTDNDLVNNKKVSPRIDEGSVPGYKVLSTVGGTKIGNQNANMSPYEDETENIEIEDKLLHPDDDFSKLVERDISFPDTNQLGRKTLNTMDKYPRMIDEEDTYLGLQFGRVNKRYKESDIYPETKSPNIIEDEFSQLVNEENINSSEVSLKASPADENSRRIDHEDIQPNIQYGRLKLDMGSENEKYTHKSDHSKIFSQAMDERNVASNELPTETNSNTPLTTENAQRYDQSLEFDDDDVYPNVPHVHKNKPSLSKIQADSKKQLEFTSSPEIKNKSEKEIDTDQKLSTLNDPDGKLSTLDEPDGKLSILNDPNGKLSTLNYRNSKLSILNDPDGKLSTLNDPDGKLSTLNDLDGQTYPEVIDTSSHIQTWSVVFTVIGTVLLDFCSDACQSPSRTYLLDVTIPSDHAAGLSTFTVMAGFGGAVGYTMGALHWETTSIGKLLGGQVNTVFLIVTIIFIICLLTTVTSFPEIPLSVLKDPKMFKEYKEKFQSDSCPISDNELELTNTKPELELINTKPKHYGSTGEGLNVLVDKGEGATSVGCDTHNRDQSIENKFVGSLYENIPGDACSNKIAVSKSVEVDVADELGCANEHPTLKDFLRSIIHMPNSLRVLCLTNLFCWMSLVCYSLYFTDFVGESVFGGNPQAPEDSASYLSYQNGVQFGCWGMALYSLSCSIYSLFIESLVKKLGARTVYIGGQLVYSIGMVVMALTRHKVAVILLSPTAGIMYSTLFTMPYLLIAHYHCNNQFSDGEKGSSESTRGIGTDVAAVSSMVFLSQFILSLSMGSIIEAIGSTVVPVCAASLLSACGAIAATQVTYLDI